MAVTPHTDELEAVAVALVERTEPLLLDVLAQQALVAAAVGLPTGRRHVLAKHTAASLLRRLMRAEIDLEGPEARASCVALLEYLMMDITKPERAS